MNKKILFIGILLLVFSFIGCDQGTGTDPKSVIPSTVDFNSDGPGYATDDNQVNINSTPIALSTTYGSRRVELYFNSVPYFAALFNENNEYCKYILHDPYGNIFNGREYIPLDVPLSDTFLNVYIMEKNDDNWIIGKLRLKDSLNNYTIIDYEDDLYDVRYGRGYDIFEATSINIIDDTKISKTVKFNCDGISDWYAIISDEGDTEFKLITKDSSETLISVLPTDSYLNVRLYLNTSGYSSGKISLNENNRSVVDILSTSNGKAFAIGMYDEDLGSQSNIYPINTFIYDKGIINANNAADYYSKPQHISKRFKVVVDNGGSGLLYSEAVISLPDGTRAVKNSDSWANDYYIIFDTWIYPFPSYVYVYWHGHVGGIVGINGDGYLRAKVTLRPDVYDDKFEIDYNGGSVNCYGYIYDVEYSNSDSTYLKSIFNNEWNSASQTN